MMRYCLLALGLILCGIAPAQKDRINRKDSIRIMTPDYIYTDLTVDRHRTSVPRLPADSIVFVDMRYDTTFIALNWRPRYRDHVFKSKNDITGGLARGLTDYCNRYYSFSPVPEGRLICYVKEFSITWKVDLLDHFMQGVDFMQKINNKINVEIDCYYQQGNSLYPAVRLDTTYTGDFVMKQTGFDDAVKMMLQPFQDKIEHMDIAAIRRRNAYTPDEITERYASRFRIPILTDTVYKKGIYTSLAELRNHKPAIDSFVISTDKMKYSSSFEDYLGTVKLLAKATQKRSATVYFYTSDKKLINPATIFAYCDGSTFWLQHGATYYPLIKVGNAFEFLYIHYFAGYKDITTGMQYLLPLNIETGHSN